MIEMVVHPSDGSATRVLDVTSEQTRRHLILLHCTDDAAPAFPTTAEPVQTSLSARAASGHAATEPAIPLMKSRRLMQPPSGAHDQANSIAKCSRRAISNGLTQRVGVAVGGVIACQGNNAPGRPWVVTQQVTCGIQKLIKCKYCNKLIGHKSMSALRRCALANSL